MNKKTFKIISIIFGIIAVLGLISFLGGVHTVNIGVFVFPAFIAFGALFAYKKK